MAQPQFIVQEHFLSASPVQRRQKLQQLFILYLKNAVQQTPHAALQ